jgi:hypothetical protein
MRMSGRNYSSKPDLVLTRSPILSDLCRSLRSSHKYLSFLFRSLLRLNSFTFTQMHVSLSIYGIVKNLLLQMVDPLFEIINNLLKCMKKQLLSRFILLSSTISFMLVLLNLRILQSSIQIAH